MKADNKSILKTYLTLTAGAGFAATADGATTVTFYGINSANDTNPDPAGISIGISPYSSSAYVLDNSAVIDSYFGYNNTTVFGYFSNGSVAGDFSANNGYVVASYAFNGVGQYGAVLGSAANYAYISFNGNDGVYEAVGQFFLDGAGGGYLIAIARNDDNSALLLSDAKTAIDVAAVPEPSSLALLALGSAGLLARRNRNKAA